MSALNNMSMGKKLFFCIKPYEIYIMGINYISKKGLWRI